MEEVEHFIRTYRDWFYLISIAWTFFEGETFVLFAGAACAYGLLDPFKLGLCAWLGSCLGDMCWFMLGRKFGPLVLRRFPSWKRGIDAVHRWLERWDTLFILSFRFLYGVRNFSAVALGLSELATWRFVVLNAIAAAIWSVVFVGAGYFFGRTLGRLLGDYAETAEIAAAVAFAIGVAAVSLFARWRSRQSRRGILLPAERLWRDPPR